MAKEGCKEWDRGEESALLVTKHALREDAAQESDASDACREQELDNLEAVVIGRDELRGVDIALLLLFLFLLVLDLLLLWTDGLRVAVLHQIAFTNARQMSTNVPANSSCPACSVLREL